MKTLIYPDRKGSFFAKRFRNDCIALSVICFIAAVFFFFVDETGLSAGLAGAGVALAFLGALFRILGCIAYDLETIAATKMTEYTDNADDLRD